ncbi:MAG: sulfotransferase [Desulfomonile tiedjei]|nr:sulfotransferase [Desulfomonile tiedjei]
MNWMRKWKRLRAHPQIIQGMTLGTLLRVLARNRFLVDSQCLGRLAYLLVLGVFNSLFGAYESLFNARAVERVKLKKPPLFILGHWRSGTTHLHNLLCQDNRLACPRAFQAEFPHHFIFSFTQAGVSVFDFIAPSKRPMDNVSFAANVPHEDEFALAAASAVSPYMKTLFPVTDDNTHSCLDPRDLSPKALEEWKRAMILFLKKLTLLQPGRVVLKSPPHLGRVATLLEMFPDAQFVHIVRNPYDVYLSSHKLWKDGFAHAHLQIPKSDQIDELILSWYAELFALFERDRSLIPPGNLYEMTYEDLVARPLETLQAMYEGLNLPGFGPFANRVTAYLGTISDYQTNAYRLNDAAREKVAERWRSTFERYGYPI